MNIAVFCGSSTPKDPCHTADAARVGTIIANGGHTLVYGGSNLGIMGAVSGAALRAGSSVTGVIPTFFSEEIITSQPVTTLIRVASMAERKEYIIDTCDAFIALPGGIGTLDEVLEVMVYNQLSPMRSSSDDRTVTTENETSNQLSHTRSTNGEAQPLVKPIALLNRGGFFNSFMAQINVMEANGFLRKGTAHGLTAFDTPDALEAFINNLQNRQ